jgi:hypothetical protein
LRVSDTTGKDEKRAAPRDGVLETLLHRNIHTHHPTPFRYSSSHVLFLFEPALLFGSLDEGTASHNSELMGALASMIIWEAPFAVWTDLLRKLAEFKNLFRAEMIARLSSKSRTG